MTICAENRVRECRARMGGCLGYDCGHYRGREIIMAGYDDPKHEGNSAKHHTGKECIEGCGRPAGTAWSPYWCFECNVDRINKINGQFEKLLNPGHAPEGGE